MCVSVFVSQTQGGCKSCDGEYYQKAEQGKVNKGGKGRKEVEQKAKEYKRSGGRGGARRQGSGERLLGYGGYGGKLMAGSESWSGRWRKEQHCLKMIEKKGGQSSLGCEEGGHWFGGCSDSNLK